MRRVETGLLGGAFTRVSLFSLGKVLHGCRKKKTDRTGPHPVGLEKGEKELKSQEGRVAYDYAVLTVPHSPIY
jgi:hypothetical protein